jgi:hypothetical protein
MKRTVLSVAAFLALLVPAVAHAVPIGFHFTGTVQYAGGSDPNLLGGAFAIGSAVTGVVAYDTEQAVPSVSGVYGFPAGAFAAVSDGAHTLGGIPGTFWISVTDKLSAEGDGLRYSTSTTFDGLPLPGSTGSGFQLRLIDSTQTAVSGLAPPEYVPTLSRFDQHVLDFFAQAPDNGLAPPPLYYFRADVTSIAAVPDAGSSLLLLGIGLVGLRGWNRRLG